MCSPRLREQPTRLFYLANCKTEHERAELTVQNRRQRQEHTTFSEVTLSHASVYFQIHSLHAELFPRRLQGFTFYLPTPPLYLFQRQFSEFFLQINNIIKSFFSFLDLTVRNKRSQIYPRVLINQLNVNMEHRVIYCYLRTKTRDWETKSKLHYKENGSKVRISLWSLFPEVCIQILSSVKMDSLAHSEVWSHWKSALLISKDS